MVRAL
jgi:hypothetical protein